MHMTPTAAEFIRRVAGSIEGSQALALRMLLHPLTRRLAGMRPHNNSLSAGLHGLDPMLHNTITPTQLKAGVKVNVIPSEAQAALDGRLLPGFDLETFLDELRPRLGGNIEIEIDQYYPPLEAPSDTPLFRTIERNLLRSDPGGIVVPYLLSGATDAKLFSQLGMRCYGFSPMKLRADEPFDRLIHAHDERISVEALTFGVGVLYETVRDFCQT
jgi:acetylornithine deacetylase/succinyl-diaminopimelate desuccinylase-like protein